ncbi:MAG: FAD-binding protein, partial [Candidatus Viridilinea halotolerans]
MAIRLGGSCLNSAPSVDLPPIREDEPMARHASWRAGGRTRYYSEAHSAIQALALAAWAMERNLPLLWVGRGTNLLVRDAGYPGLLVSHRAQAWRLEDHGDSALLHVEAGSPMAGLARRITRMGWAGLVWAEGLPGSVGGAVVGNAGCYGGDVATSLVSAELLLGGQVVTWPVERFGFGYRMSVLKRGGEAERRGGEASERGEEGESGRGGDVDSGSGEEAESGGAEAHPASRIPH